jgi:CubicO group peptidase (beta-lactamase class C family)
MRRAAAIALLLLLARPAHAQPRADATWVGMQAWPPAIAGTLTLERTGSAWRARVGDRTADGTMAGDTVRLAFGTDGTLRVRAWPEGPHALWVTPAGAQLPALATPVPLARTGGMRWRGTIAADTARLRLAVLFGRDSLGAPIARFRNPEWNFGGGRTFRVESLPGALAFVDVRTGRRRYTQPFDAAARTLTFDFGAPIVLRPVTADAAGWWRPLAPGTHPVLARPAGERGGWPTAHPRDVGADTGALATLLARLGAGDTFDADRPRVHALLVARHGRLVVEQYFFGDDRATRHDLRSASKTFTSVLLGAAMRRGVRVAMADTLTPGGATVAQLLVHTSGLACDDDDDASPGNEDRMQAQDTQPDWVAYARALPQRHPPGAHYAYCSAGINLVGGHVAARAGEWGPALFDRLVARPLGWGTYAINLMPTGGAYFAGGMRVTARDLLTVGQLALDDGRWRGRRVVDAAWMRAAVARQHRDTSGVEDGWAWHRHVVRVRGREVATYEASGNGGQFVLVAPALGAVVALTAEHFGEGARWFALRERVIAEALAALTP